MRTRLWIVGAMSAGAIAAAVVLTQPMSASAGPDKKIHVVEKGTNETYVPAGSTGTPPRCGSASTPSCQGDYIVFDDPLYASDAAGAKQVGHIMGTCHVVDVTASDAHDVYYCSVEYFLANGEISAVGPFDVDGTATRAPVTGGTGSYMGATGQSQVKLLPDGNIDHVISVGNDH